MADRICAYCGETIVNPWGAQKYHKDCYWVVNRANTEKRNAARLAERLRKIANGETTKRNLPETYDITTNGLTGIDGLVEAIVQQAIDDWRYLCDDGTETYHCNFTELEEFFKVECPKLLNSKVDTAERLWEKMQEERTNAGL